LSLEERLGPERLFEAHHFFLQAQDAGDWQSGADESSLAGWIIAIDG
jgi:hypothetical protein